MSPPFPWSCTIGILVSVSPDTGTHGEWGMRESPKQTSIYCHPPRRPGPTRTLGKPRGGTMVRPSNRMGSVPGPTLWAKPQSAHATCLKATQHAIEAFTSRDETQEKMCQHARCATGAEGVQLVGKLTDGWKVG